MSTLSGLLLRQPEFSPFDLGRTLTQATNIAGGQLGNQTALLQLEELRRQQETAARVRQRLQQDPGIILDPGGSTLASPALTIPPGGPQSLPRGAGVSPQGGGPIPPEVAAQVMPTVTPPGGGPPSTLGGLTQQPRQNSLEALMRQDPDAALQIMKLQQGQQDRQWKIQEQELDRREKVTGYLAKQLQGVTDQETLDGLRQDLQRGGMSQYAAALPQFYSKEAIEPLITRAQTALENATTAKALADARKATQQAQTEEYNRTVFLPQVLADDRAPGSVAPAPSTNGTAASGRQTSAPAEVETAVQEAVRQYPRVRPEIARAIIAQESNFDRQAVSPAGAQGYMQLMPATQREMGVKDPFDTRQNILGGVGYYDKLLTRYDGDEQQALAAYNAGPGRVDAAKGDLKALPQETQDYVPKVLQRAQVGATARGPATGPQAQRLEAQIADLTRKREQYAKAAVVKPELHTYVDTLTRHIDDLRRERDRLEELPRKIEEQRALLPGQKEVARAGEETKAELERATREEIDAINRGLPPDQRIPYGTTREEIRKKKLVGGIPIPEKGNEELIARSTIVQQLGELKTKFGDMPTGPIQSRLNEYRERLGIDLKDEAVAYKTLLNTVRNRVVNALSGAAVSPDEAKRILAELPDEGTSPQAFKGRLETALKIAEDVYKRRAQYYRRSGHSVPESLMTPYWDEPLPGATGSGSVAATPSSNVDKFKGIKP